MDNSPRLFGATTLLVLRITSVAAAPVAAAVYLVLWNIAEVGRHSPPNIVLFALFAVALGLSTWMPRTAMGLVLAIGALQALGLVAPTDDTTWPASLAIAFVVFFVGLFARGLTRWLAVPVVVASSLLFAFVTAFPTDARPYRWGSWVGDGPLIDSPRRDAETLALAALAVGLAAWLIGIAVSSFIAVVERDVERVDTQLARAGLDLRIADDRARISRDVHDSLAHSLAVIVSQAQGAVALAASRPGGTAGPAGAGPAGAGLPAAGSMEARSVEARSVEARSLEAQTLETVAEVARTALVDVRGLVERIQTVDDVILPRATLADVPDLVEQMRSLGMSIDLELSGDERIALTDAQQVAVYRIVQESLTNALKHSGSTSRVTVDLASAESGVSVHVSSSGDQPLVDGVGPGAGIAGMKERARLAGGWLRAAPVGKTGESAFVVTAFVPSARGGVQNA
ncbi:hypothetical protein AX769_20005 [Frondihabitans sp. PAMC 28766]|uniref:sensor histidine kinase n=1 Tax=Frondihabitans sp. PAMC 28766 TaxID=1795630 RepID=UPI00078DC07F|nr:histidine kinase [Frondihabitans sp. PAMC 28766]AMM22012.1 hypothetical protein AX769_20005 [Frondihabitans sp. PAMC 28766]